jgi:hypothetical protein
MNEKYCHKHDFLIILSSNQPFKVPKNLLFYFNSFVGGKMDIIRNNCAQLRNQTLVSSMQGYYNIKVPTRVK